MFLCDFLRLIRFNGEKGTRLNTIRDENYGVPDKNDK